MWGDEAGLDAAQRRVDQWESSLTERAVKAGELSRRLAGLTATKSSDDGLVQATVDASGVLIGLQLAEQIRTQPASRTAERILATTRAAHRAAVQQARTAAVETLGADDPATQAITDAYDQRLHPTDPQRAGA